MKNFMSYEDALTLMTAIENKFGSLNCYVLKGSTTFAGLPATIDSTMVGFVYNMTEDFVTDSRFIEGAGKQYYAGENVAIADRSTYAAVTPQAGDDPSAEGWYELVNGKYVLSEDTEVDPLKTYYEKTEIYKFDCLGEFVDVDAILDVICKDDFVAANPYAIGDVVKHNSKLYRFKAEHTANDPWDPTEVDEIDVVQLIKDAEPDSLTQAQINQLIALLG